MGETKPTADLPKDPAPGAGVRSLMQGTRTAPSEKSEVPSPQVLIRIPPWYYFGLDILLLVVVIGVAWPNPAALSWKAQFLCLALVALGAAASVVGVLKSRD